MLTRRKLLVASAGIALFKVQRAAAWFPHGVGGGPVLSLDTGMQAASPQFTLIVPTSVAPAGTITYQSSTSFSFTSPTTTTQTLTASNISSIVSMGASALGSNVTYYYRAKYNSSPWSNIVTLALSVPSEPGTPTFYGKAPNGFVATNNANGLMFYNMDIGYPAADRFLIVGLGYNIISGDIGASGTIYISNNTAGNPPNNGGAGAGGACYNIGAGQVAMTQAVQAVETSHIGCSIWYANVATGNLADIAISGTGGFNWLSFQYGIAYAAPTLGNTANTTTATTNPLTCSAVTIGNPGFAVAMAVTDTAITWNNNYSDPNANNSFTYQGDPIHTSMASSVTAGSSVASINKSTNSACMCVAAWGP